MDHHALTIEQEFGVPARQVWSAITNPEEMKHWYFDLPGFKAEPGFVFRFTGGPSPEKQYLHICEVKEVISLQKLSYSWCYDGYAGDSLVSFELWEQEECTLLRLTHSGLETFPKEKSDLARHNFEEGWHQIIRNSLNTYLACPVTTIEKK